MGVGFFLFFSCLIFLLYSLKIFPQAKGGNMISRPLAEIGVFIRFVLLFIAGTILHSIVLTPQPPAVQFYLHFAIIFLTFYFTLNYFTFLTVALKRLKGEVRSRCTNSLRTIRRICLLGVNALVDTLKQTFFASATPFRAGRNGNETYASLQAWLSLAIKSLTLS